MSTAPLLAVGQATAGIDDTSYSVFQALNDPLNQTLVCGNIFLGLQGYIAVRIPMGLLLGLARGGKIETGLTSASVSFTANGTWTDGGTINCNVMIDDSPRLGPVRNDLAWKPPAGIGPNWRPDQWGVFDQRLEDTGGTPFLDNGVGTSGTFGIRAVAGQRERIAGRFIVPAGPNWSIARTLLRLRRFGNPTGSMEVAIQGSIDDGFGHVIPDGVDIAVSTAVLNSTIPVSPGSGQITYPFTPDVSLAPGTYWTIIRPSVPYPVSLVDFVVWLQKRVFFGIGGAHYTTTGVALDIGNYPGHIDVFRDAQARKAGTDIVWNPVARSVGQSISTPDLSPLVQEVILNSGHETASALMFTFETVGETRTYRFASASHATLNPPGFACQFTRRNIFSHTRLFDFPTEVTPSEILESHVHIVRASQESVQVATRLDSHLHAYMANQETVSIATVAESHVHIVDESEEKVEL